MPKYVCFIVYTTLFRIYSPWYEQNPPLNPNYHMRFKNFPLALFSLYLLPPNLSIDRGYPFQVLILVMFSLKISLTLYFELNILSLYLHIALQTLHIICVYIFLYRIQSQEKSYFYHLCIPSTRYAFNETE